jgi:type VI secretion system secreted protein VgrG
MPSTQTSRSLRVDTVLGPDALLLHAFTGEEAVSRPFRFVLELSAEGALVPDADALLGTAACVTVRRPDGGEARRVHGLVSRFRRRAAGAAAHGYEMELVPWLWMLSLSADCRIFQHKSVPDIVAEVFRDLGYADFQTRLVGTYAPREYCVQYRETHLAFVSRLLEDEGIFYYFEHHAGKHVLVLADGSAGVDPVPGGARLEAAADGAPAWGAGRDAYTRLTVERAVYPAKVTLTDYHYGAPSASLEASLETTREVAGGRGEVFDYPGGYTAPDEGSRYARLRAEELESGCETADGASAAAQVTAGHRLELAGTDDGAGAAWFVLAVHHSARQGGYVAGDGPAFTYENAFTAVRAAAPWRPPRRTPRPRVRGTQSALVVGKAGEEIWTDAQGRVKLHFYWDRRGRRDQHSSCWVRCSAAWAGKGWGQFSVPRIGQEVLVDFLEGDPDRPVVVGRVYNAEQPPPCNPGAVGGVVSGLRSKTHKGAGYNAIEMDDTAGKELVSVHAQYDMDTRVEHDERVTVGNDRTESVGHDERVSIGNDRTASVEKNETLTVGENQSLSVGKDQTVSVGKDQSLAVAGNRSKSVGKDETVDVGAGRTTSVGKDDTLHVGNRLVVDAGDEIVLRTGDASLTMARDGTITLRGADIRVQGSGKVQVKADSDVVIKGSKVLAN